MTDANRPAVLVVGLGNRLRGDDGAGLEVVRRVRDRAHHAGIDVHELSGDPTGLLDVWLGREAVVLVDTMCSGAAPGTIRRLDASDEPLPERRRGSSSTHAAGLAGTIELGRALGSLPARVIVYAVEAGQVDVGVGLSDELEAIVPALVTSVLREARSLRTSDGSDTCFSAR